MAPEEIVSDSEIDSAWGNANFGDEPKRSVLADTVLKIASGFHTGKFATEIAKELGLVNASGNQLLKKVRMYLYAAHSKSKY